MNNLWAIIVFALVAAVAVPKFMDNVGEEKVRLAVQREAPANTRSAPAAFGQAIAYRDASGQFTFNARLNGVLDNVLVDTGASYVAINETLASRIGLDWQSGREVHVSTANGKTVARAAMIEDIEINDIMIRNVEALVLPDSSLSHSLLGMTFLKRLDRFEIESQQLTLTQ